MVNGKPGPAKGTKKPMKPAGEPEAPWRAWIAVRRPRPPYEEWKRGQQALGKYLPPPEKKLGAKKLAPLGHTARPAPTPPDLAARIVPPPAASYAVPLDDLDRWETELGDGLQGVNPEVLQLRAELRYLRAENERKDRHGRNLLLVLAGAAMLAILSWAFGLF